MRKNYWKECCLLLVGFIFGFYIQETSGKPIYEENLTSDTIVIKDTVRDTVFIKTSVPPISKQSVLEELIKQSVPHADIVLAQSILETGNYTSRLCKNYNNIFGLKKGNSYRRYNNYVECIADYKRLISSRYKGGDYYEFLNRIHYAENGSYTKILKDMV